MKKRVLLSWSSGKDSAWTLKNLIEDKDVEVVGLLTTYNSEFKRVAIHGVRNELLKQQAENLCLPLFDVPLPWPCSNEVYEQTIISALAEINSKYEISHVAHGDLFLQDVRDYRLNLMAKTKLKPLFPIWGLETAQLARNMIDYGVKAYVTCLDPKRVDASFAGRLFDHTFLDDLPDDVDPCGENGEFHTFVFGCPMFKKNIKLKLGEVVERDGAVYADLLPTY